MSQLEVEPATVLRTAHALHDDADELRQELSALNGQWQNLSNSWSGRAASAYSALWDEWRESATQVVEALANSAQDLAQAAVAYADRDVESAQAVEAPSIDLGL